MPKRPTYTFKGVERRIWVKGVHRRGESLIALSLPSFEPDEKLALKVAEMMHGHMLPKFDSWHGSVIGKRLEIHVRRRGRATKVYQFELRLDMARKR